MPTLSDYITELENGFPVTTEPTILPEIQEKTFRFARTDKVGISYAAEGVQWAHDDCLEFCRDVMCNAFCSEMHILHEVSERTLTVSYPLSGFVIGKNCTDFCLETPEDDADNDCFFTYQMVSKQCQATYYNKDHQQYLAGICYYLQLKDTPLITISIDSRAILYVMYTAFQTSYCEGYQPGDRWKFMKKSQYSDLYGRFCETAGKRVVVRLQENNVPVHVHYDYRTREYETKECEECREEAKTYKFMGKQPGDNDN